MSVPSNIAEGLARRSTKSLVHFLSISRGSLDEIDTQMEIAEALGYFEGIDLSQAIETFDNLSRALQAAISGLERKLSR